MIEQEKNAQVITSATTASPATSTASTAAQVSTPKALKRPSLSCPMSSPKISKNSEVPLKKKKTDVNDIPRTIMQNESIPDQPSPLPSVVISSPKPKPSPILPNLRKELEQQRKQIAQLTKENQELTTSKQDLLMKFAEVDAEKEALKDEVDALKDKIERAQRVLM